MNGLLKGLLASKKTVIGAVGTFLLLGLLIIYFAPHEKTTSVTANDNTVTVNVAVNITLFEFKR